MIMSAEDESNLSLGVGSDSVDKQLREAGEEGECSNDSSGSNINSNINSNSNRSGSGIVQQHCGAVVDNEAAEEEEEELEELEEEVTYAYVEFPELDGHDIFNAVSTKAARFRGLFSTEPECEIDNMVFRGTHASAIGTNLILNTGHNNDNGIVGVFNRIIDFRLKRLINIPITAPAAPADPAADVPTIHAAAPAMNIVKNVYNFECKLCSFNTTYKNLYASHMYSTTHRKNAESMKDGKLPINLLSAVSDSDVISSRSKRGAANAIDSVAYDNNAPSKSRRTTSKNDFNVDDAVLVGGKGTIHSGCIGFICESNNANVINSQHMVRFANDTRASFTSPDQFMFVEGEVISAQCSNCMEKAFILSDWWPDRGKSWSCRMNPHFYEDSSKRCSKTTDNIVDQTGDFFSYIPVAFFPPSQHPHGKNTATQPNFEAAFQFLIPKNALKEKEAELFELMEENGVEIANDLKFINIASLKKIAAVLRQAKKNQFLDACGISVELD